MKVAIEKEQLKAVVREAMISVLTEDVYGTPVSGLGSDAFGTHTEYKDDLAATSFPRTRSYASPTWRRTDAAMRASDRKRAANGPAPQH